MLRRRNQRHVSADESDEPVIGGSMIAIAITDDAASRRADASFRSAYSLYNVLMYRPSVPVVNWAQGEIHIVSGCRQHV